MEQLAGSTDSNTMFIINMLLQLRQAYKIVLKDMFGPHTKLLLINKI
jgi:hypothetical protein